jgi:hypothetical protein
MDDRHLSFEGALTGEICLHSSNKRVKDWDKIGRFFTILILLIVSCNDLRNNNISFACRAHIWGILTTYICIWSHFAKLSGHTISGWLRNCLPIIIKPLCAQEGIEPTTTRFAQQWCRTKIEEEKKMKLRLHFSSTDIFCSYFCIVEQDCQILYFRTKNTNLGKFWSTVQW